MTNPGFTRREWTIRIAAVAALLTTGVGALQSANAGEAVATVPAAAPSAIHVDLAQDWPLVAWTESQWDRKFGPASTRNVERIRKHRLESQSARPQPRCRSDCCW